MMKTGHEVLDMLNESTLSYTIEFGEENILIIHRYLFGDDARYLGSQWNNLENLNKATVDKLGYILALRINYHEKALESFRNAAITLEKSKK